MADSDDVTDLIKSLPELKAFYEDALEKSADPVPVYGEVHPEDFKAAIAASPIREKILKGHGPQEYAPQPGKRYFLAHDDQSGFAVGPTGEAQHLFSANPFHTFHALKAQMANGATHTDVYADNKGMLDRLGAAGWVEHRREPNWNPGGPDVVYLRHGQMQKAWPTDAESKANHEAHLVFMDHAHEQGKIIPPGKVKLAVRQARKTGAARTAPHMPWTEHYAEPAGGSSIDVSHSGWEAESKSPHKAWQKGIHHGMALAADQRFWEALGREVGLNKSWPKDEQENHINATTHAVMEDSMYEHGAEKKVIAPKQVATDLNRKMLQTVPSPSFRARYAIGANLVQAAKLGFTGPEEPAPRGSGTLRDANERNWWQDIFDLSDPATTKQKP